MCYYVLLTRSPACGALIEFGFGLGLGSVVGWGKALGTGLNTAALGTGLQYLVDIALKLLGSRITELLALHDSAASVTGSGLMTALSGADCGARSDGNEALWLGVAGARCVGLCRRVWDRRLGTATLELCATGLGTGL
jgi:hypothetical protein